MAWASRKQYAILMSSDEGKDLAQKLADMEQADFNKAFGELLGKGGVSSGDFGNDGSKKPYKNGYANRDKEEFSADFEEATSIEEIDANLADSEWELDYRDKTDMNTKEIMEKLKTLTIDKIAENVGVKEFTPEYEEIVKRVNARVQNAKDQFSIDDVSEFGLEQDIKLFIDEVTNANDLKEKIFNEYNDKYNLTELMGGGLRKKINKTVNEWLADNPDEVNWKK